MKGKLASLAFDVGVAVAILTAVGSIGHIMNWCNPGWAFFGVNPSAIKTGIANTPYNCPELVRPVCQIVANTAAWFLGLNGGC